MTADAIYEERGSHWSQQVSAVASTWWLQRDQTLSLSVKGVACETTIIANQSLASSPGSFRLGTRLFSHFACFQAFLWLHLLVSGSPGEIKQIHRVQLQVFKLTFRLQSRDHMPRQLQFCSRQPLPISGSSWGELLQLGEVLNWKPFCNLQWICTLSQEIRSSS